MGIPCDQHGSSGGRSDYRLSDFVGFPEEKQETTIKNLNVVELKRVQSCAGPCLKTPVASLDELTTGLNPHESREAVGLIKKIRDQGNVNPYHRACNERDYGSL